MIIKIMAMMMMMSFERKKKEKTTTENNHTKWNEKRPLTRFALLYRETLQIQNDRNTIAVSLAFGDERKSNKKE